MQNGLNEFFAAVKSGDLKKVAALLAADPDLVRARDERDATALHHAAFNADRELVEVLLQHGADLNAIARDTGTPAGWAMHALREKGALLAIEIDDALFAIRRGDVDWVRRFVTRHPQLRNAKTADGSMLAEHARRSGISAINDLFARTTD